MPHTALRALAERWADAKPAERANAQLYIGELCAALGVEPPRPAAEAGAAYSYEHPLKVVAEDGTESTNFIDCYKAGHFALEAKSFAGEDSEDRRLRRAFAQVWRYAGQIPEERPPYIMVLDVGKTLLVWDRWSGDYGGFNAAKRIDLPTLDTRPADIALLRDIWENPKARDTSARALAVTRSIAERLAELAAALEGRGHEQEAVARFLIRVVFTMFAEDVDLLAPETFRDMLADVPVKELPEALEDLWRSMDKGLRFGGRKLARFNGHFFHDSKALPLTKDDQALLLLAANAEWQDVEPSIFGTLLVRALDPVERHRLGAEFTPREFVERVVRPTVEEPVRERWNLVQAEVLQLRETGKEKDRKAALKSVQGFHEWLCGLSILDPACGSGNFLYVTLHLLKRIELEVKDLENELRKGGDADFRLFEVHPRQFHGIEVKPWAREIAELTLWIGYHQFWKQHEHSAYKEPILEDTGTIECRDAVLAWKGTRHEAAKDEPDLTPRIKNPVTGALVPDPKARHEYLVHEQPRPSKWPEADFIVGNPPYLGGTSMREALGSGYVDALRHVYAGELPDGADFVMYWWARAAAEVASGRTLRAGLITTNSISQRRNRAVVEAALGAGVRVAWVVADHPVIAGGHGESRIATVDDDAAFTSLKVIPKIHADLTGAVDVAAATSVRKNAEVLRPYRNGKDLTTRPRAASLIDFNMMSQDEASRFSQLYDIVRDRVKPERAVKKEPQARKYWWQLWRTRGELRLALNGLTRCVATPETAKHRFFVFLESAIAPDHSLVAFATNDAAILGVVSSRIHLIWALAAGSRLGVGNDPRYNKSVCLDPFPFPHSSKPIASRIAIVMERLEPHRKDALIGDERVTMTKMYNVVEKLRSGEALTPAERTIHEVAAWGVLKDMHDELDALVAEAYGWPWPMEKEEILERLVKLHDERVEEEKRGLVRWLRPEYQIPRFEKDLAQPVELGLETEAADDATSSEPVVSPWPKTAMEQLGALKGLVTVRALTVAEAAAVRRRARRQRESPRQVGELVAKAIPPRARVGVLVAKAILPRAGVGELVAQATARLYR